MIEYTLSEHEARHVKELTDAITHNQAILAEIQKRIDETVASRAGSLQMLAVQHGIMPPGGDGNKVTVQMDGAKVTISGDPPPEVPAPSPDPTDAAPDQA